MSLFTTFSQSMAEHAWFNDRRLSQRYGQIITQIGDNFGSNPSRSAGNMARKAGLYRFMNNPNVQPSALCDADGSRLVERLRAETGRTYLAVSDTTGLNYSDQKSSANLNCLDAADQKGMYLHSMLLLDANGCPEGLVRSAFFDRQADTIGVARKERNTNAGPKKPIEDKESYRWLEDMNELHKLFGGMTQHRFVHIGDSEADMFEWFANRRYTHIHYLTRLHHNRCIAGEDQYINTALENVAVLGCKTCQVKDEYTHKFRTAKLELKWVKVTLKVPQSLRTYQKQKEYDDIECYVLQAQEIDFKPRKYTNAQGQTKYTEPLCWRLITSLPITNLEQAMEVIDFYLHRWRVEDYHLVAKEGFEIEELQFETGEALRNAILVYAVVAVQVLRLRYLQQTQPDSPMDITGVDSTFFPIIAAYLQKVRKIKVPTLQTPNSPTVAEFTLLITLLGTGNPKNKGIRALWLGIREFTIVINTYFTFFHTD